MIYGPNVTYSSGMCHFKTPIAGQRDGNLYVPLMRGINPLTVLRRCAYIGSGPYGVPLPESETEVPNCDIGEILETDVGMRRNATVLVFSGELLSSPSGVRKREVKWETKGTVHWF